MNFPIKVMGDIETKKIDVLEYWNWTLGVLRLDVACCSKADGKDLSFGSFN